MTEKPQLFVELLTYLYRPEHETEAVINYVETEEDVTIKENNALRALYLLRNWNTIPGVDKDGNIDLGYLKNGRRKLWNWQKRRIGKKSPIIR